MKSVRSVVSDAGRTNRPGGQPWHARDGRAKRSSTPCISPRGGEKVTEVCRRLGVSENTFYRWKKQYAGLGLQELRELRQLRDENRKLKQVVADLSLDRHILQEIVRKKL
jgi:putative transposase